MMAISVMIGLTETFTLDIQPSSSCLFSADWEALFLGFVVPQLEF